MQRMTRGDVVHLVEVELETRVLDADGTDVRGLRSEHRSGSSQAQFRASKRMAIMPGTLRQLARCSDRHVRRWRIGEPSSFSHHR